MKRNAYIFKNICNGNIYRNKTLVTHNFGQDYLKLKKSLIETMHGSNLQYLR